MHILGKPGIEVRGGRSRTIEHQVQMLRSRKICKRERDYGSPHDLQLFLYEVRQLTVALILGTPIAVSAVNLCKHSLPHTM